MMTNMTACQREVIKPKQCVNEQGERERDSTLVSEQHTKNRLKVNIAGFEHSAE